MSRNKEPNDQPVPFEAFIRPPLRSIDKFAEPKLPFISQRCTVAVMAFLGFCVMYATRYSSRIARVYFEDNEPDTESNPRWILQGHLDNYSFQSSMFGQLIGGIIAYKFPSNKIFGLGIVSSAVLNLLIPQVSNNLTILTIIYILQGFIQGAVIPALFGIWKFWSPPLERTKLLTIAFSGMYAGLLIGSLITGHPAVIVHWSLGFIIFGFFGIIWYGFWYWLVVEKPRDHPAISEQELIYIEKALGESAKFPMDRIPWIKIFSSLPVYAVLVAEFCQKYSYYFIAKNQGKFLRHRFAFRIDEQGLITYLPFLLGLLIVPIGGCLADILRRRRTSSTTSIRKIFTCISFGLQAVCFIFLHDSKTAAGSLLLIMLSLAFSGFAVAGYVASLLDIAPRLASIIVGFLGIAGYLSAIICEIVTEFMYIEHDKDTWNSTFTVTASVLAVGAVIYGIFGSGEQQTWAEPKIAESEELEGREN